MQKHSSPSPYMEKLSRRVDQSDGKRTSMAPDQNPQPAASLRPNSRVIVPPIEKLDPGSGAHKRLACGIAAMRSGLGFFESGVSG
jgi:hypothetical protein